MNRAFYIIVAPAVLIAAAYLAVFYGRIVPRPVAFGVAAVALAAIVVQQLRGKAAKKPGENS